MQGWAEERFGDSTTSGSEGEESQHGARMREVAEASGSVFADADEEYASLPAVKRRLTSWQASHPAAYRDAYMPLSGPAIFAPFVRLELLSWEPLGPSRRL